MLEYQEAKNDEISKDYTKVLAYDSEPGNNNLSIDFLKNFLSEELNNIDDDLLLCTSEKNEKDNVSQTTPTMKNTFPEADASTEQTLNELYDLFGD